MGVASTPVTYFVYHLLYVDEADFFHITLEQVGVVSGFLDDLATLVEFLNPLHHIGHELCRVIVRIDGTRIFLNLEDASWLQVIESLGEELLPMSDTTNQGSTVNVIEMLGFRIGPGTFQVIDIEPDIWRYPVRLDSTEIIAQY